MPRKSNFGFATASEAFSRRGRVARYAGLFDAEEHPRGQPQNAGEFASKQGIAGQQQGLFGGDDLRTGQKSLFNVVRPVAGKKSAKAKHPQHDAIVAALDAKTREFLKSKETLSPADAGVVVQEPSLPGQKAMFSRSRSSLVSAFNIVAGPQSLAAKGVKNLADFKQNPSTIVDNSQPKADTAPVGSVVEPQHIQPIRPQDAKVGSKTMLVSRATGKGNYRLYEFDGTKITAAWPANETGGRAASTDIETGRSLADNASRPSSFVGQLRKDWLAALAAFDGKSFNWESAAPETKKPGVTISLRQASHLGGHAKPFVAKITGSSSQFRFSREFLQPVNGWDFRLTDGVYHVCDRNSKGAKRESFVEVTGDTSKDLTREEVEARFPAIEQPAGSVSEGTDEFGTPPGMDRDEWLADNDEEWRLPIGVTIEREDF